jgi:DNA-binding transcriptional LysR family regulator
MNKAKASAIEAVDSRRLQVFLEAAKSTSFVAAAQTLGMVPSAVSHAIKALEEEFECSLFKRHGPRVSLTQAGMRLLPLAEELLLRMTRLRDEIVVLKGRSQHLRVLMPEIFCTLRLPSILPDFMECFPSAMFEVAIGDADSDSAVNRLDEGEIDILISYRSHEGDRVKRREVFKEQLSFYVAPFHLLASHPCPTLNMIADEPILICDAIIEKLVSSGLRRSASNSLRLWQLPSVQTVLELAGAAQGVGVLPKWAVEAAAQEDRLVPLKIKEINFSRTCSMYSSIKSELGWSAEVFSSLVSMADQA